MKAICLVSTGETWATLPEDVLFTVPNFVDIATITRCGLEMLARDEHQMAARVKVLKYIRGIEKQIEEQYFEIAPFAQKVYNMFKPDDPDAWKQITTLEVAKKYTGGKTPSLVTLLAVHKHLMRRSQEFTAMTPNFRATNIFWIRPQNQLETIRRVSSLYFSKSDKMDKFVEKARVIIAATKADRALAWSQPASQRPIEGPSFDEDDQVFVRFLEESIRTKRTIQVDPYAVATSAIMKKLALYDGEIADDMVSQMLLDLGVHTPWYEPVISNPRDMEFTKHGGVVQNSLTQVVQSGSQVLQKLGPDDLYPYDIVRDLRHDFGDMPVYVIDDFGAHELDDGLSVESIPLEPGSYWIHVHVADPTALLPPTHRIVASAMNQSTSIYRVEDSSPLLPPVPGIEGLGSKIGTGEAQNALTFSFKIDRFGDIVDYLIRPSMIKNIQICKYDDVDVALGLYSPQTTWSFPFGHSSSRSFTPTDFSPSARKDFTTLYDIALRLSRKRLDMGSLFTSLPFAEIMMTSPGQGELPPNPPSLSQRMSSTGFPELAYAVANPKSTESGARRMVAEFMKSAARVASRFFRDRNIPAVRRCANKPIGTEEAMQKLRAIQDEDGFVDYAETMKNNVVYPPAFFHLEPHGHWLLGIPEGEGYCRVTSPLRRFGDLLAHWQIKHALVNPLARPLFTDEWMQAFCVDFSVRDPILRKINRLHNLSWALKYISRWRDHPEMSAGIDVDPLKNLTVMRMGNMRHNSVVGVYSCTGFLPELGIPCKIADMPAEGIPIGEPVPAKIQSIRAGLKPAISVSI